MIVCTPPPLRPPAFVFSLICDKIDAKESSFDFFSIRNMGGWDSNPEKILNYEGCFSNIVIIHENHSFSKYRCLFVHFFRHQSWKFLLLSSMNNYSTKHVLCSFFLVDASCKQDADITDKQFSTSDFQNRISIIQKNSQQRVAKSIKC